VGRSPRARAMAIGVLSAIVLVVGGWVAASQLVSSEQRAAQAEPPPPTILTAEVTFGELSRSVSSQGVVEYQQVLAVNFEPGTGTAVVTGTPVGPGDEVDVCTPIVEVNGRPVIAVEGEFPFYRSIDDGDSGVDVLQLRAVVRSCGGDVVADGPFDGALRAALEDIYADVGYEAPGGPVNVASELIVVDSPTAVVVSVAPVGTALGEQPAATIGGGDRVLRVSAPPDVIADVDHVETRVVTPEGEIEATHVTVVEEATAESLAIVEVTVPADAAHSLPVGAEPVVMFLVDRLAVKALIVPASAIVSEGVDRTVVYRREEDGEFTAVKVTELTTLDGRTAIETPGKLTAGDLVLVGAP